MYVNPRLLIVRGQKMLLENSNGEGLNDEKNNDTIVDNTEIFGMN